MAYAVQDTNAGATPVDILTTKGTSGALQPVDVALEDGSVERPPEPFVSCEQSHGAEPEQDDTTPPPSINTETWTPFSAPPKL